MSFADRYAKYRSKRDPEFKQVWEESSLDRQLAAKLIEIRISLELSQQEFAELLGMKQSVISRLENGEQNVTIKTLEEIAKRLNANIKIDIELTKKDEDLITN